MIWILLFMVAFVVPFWKLLPQYGIASPWALIAVFPIGTLALLYLMAYAPRNQGDRK
ncbi:MAG: hypothetical protein NXH84_05010 [Rhodobacteraceae bacterium]|jgi:hypothetical protein|nr:hypothetical protein [Paracoccaceae bacterium]